jgi:hypothetical protein
MISGKGTTTLFWITPTLFPKLDAAELYKARHIDHDMLYTHTATIMAETLECKGTRDFIKNQVYTEENANELVDILKVRIERRLAGEIKL